MPSPKGDTPAEIAASLSEDARVVCRWWYAPTDAETREALRAVYRLGERTKAAFAEFYGSGCVGPDNRKTDLGRAVAAELEKQQAQ